MYQVHSRIVPRGRKSRIGRASTRKKYGADPNRWEGNVAKYLLLKSDPEYYKDDVVKYGYCRGDEPYRYVDEILERYDLYRRFIDKSSTG